MAVWYAARRTGWQANAVIAAGPLAVLLVAAVPTALFAGAITMSPGHVVGGLALFGASVLAAVVTVVTVVTAGVSSARQLRGLVSRPGYRVVRLSQSEYHVG